MHPAFVESCCGSGFVFDAAVPFWDMLTLRVLHDLRAGLGVSLFSGRCSGRLKTGW